jgi:hypothetical protein
MGPYGPAFFQHRQHFSFGPYALLACNFENPSIQNHRSSMKLSYHRTPAMDVVRNHSVEEDVCDHGPFALRPMQDQGSHE